MAAGQADLDPATLGGLYLQEVAPLYGIDTAALVVLDGPVGSEPRAEDGRLRLLEQKSLQGTTVLSYAQTHLALPVWEAGVAITLQSSPLRVTSSYSTLHDPLTTTLPPRDAHFRPAGITSVSLVTLLRLPPSVDAPRINGVRMLVYRCDPALRFADDRSPIDREPPRLPLARERSSLDLPEIGSALVAGRHYVVTEVLFTLRLGSGPALHWRAFVEVTSGSVLYLRALVSALDGCVFLRDPITATGDPSLTPCAASAALDPLATTVPLPGLVPPQKPEQGQGLAGEYVVLEDFAKPRIAPPIISSSETGFSYPARSDDFAAVNAYYHCDAAFRLLEGFGLPLGVLFDGTTFPVRIDHRDGHDGNVQAFAYATEYGTGLAAFGFNLAARSSDCADGPPAGNANDTRVVWHEFCHGLLWDTVHSDTLGFAHSAGDSLATILSDPGSAARDRFLSFPWISWLDDRRHDREVTKGWAWGGDKDGHGYTSEQILSTTLFRLYRVTGGDSPHPVIQRCAAEYVAYLIIRSIWSLSPVAYSRRVEQFASGLMEADIATQDFKGLPGGALHKVIRWSFEKQGLYQPPGSQTPVSSPGAPPSVDVFIEDGYGGEYQYAENFSSAPGVWNRRDPDGGESHQEPILGVPNHAYGRVGNRGSGTAAGIVVRAFRCRGGHGHAWPGDWNPLPTQEISLSRPMKPGEQVVVGPFEWVPSTPSHECLLLYVSAGGDLSNADPASGLPCATGAIPYSWLVPLDNNTAVRAVAPWPA